MDYAYIRDGKKRGQHMLPHPACGRFYDSASMCTGHPVAKQLSPFVPPRLVPMPRVTANKYAVPVPDYRNPGRKLPTRDEWEAQLEGQGRPEGLDFSIQHKGLVVRRLPTRLVDLRDAWRASSARQR